ncbi:MAG TPA: hypothetical protein VJB35_02880 [Candidatus Nanoarchaeia archaeon]|nr:hypothetical protein [Candidatus Nanoarchaeia archaeon]
MSSNDICTILVDELFKRDKTYLEKSIAGLNDQQLSYVYRGLATLHFSNVQKFENYFTTMCEGIKDATSKEINFLKESLEYQRKAYLCLSLAYRKKAKSLGLEDELSIKDSDKIVFHIIANHPMYKSFKTEK